MLNFIFIYEGIKSDQSQDNNASVTPTYRNILSILQLITKFIFFKNTNDLNKTKKKLIQIKGKLRL